MNGAQDHIDDLIGKYLAGEATAPERAELEQWIEANERNRVYFKQLRLVFERASTVKSTHEFDVDAAWNKVSAKMQRGGRSASFPMYWNVLKVAAILLVAAGVGFLAYQWVNQPIQTLAIVADKEIVRDSLPDGSLAVLNKKSSLKYTYNPGSNKRTVVLEGEAFFEVKHDKEKPFIIEASDVIIEDIGTTFNVKALPESSSVEVYVESGEVAFYTLEDAGLNLVAGETGIYNRQTKSFARSITVDTNRLAYKTGIFTFHNTDLGTIINDLNSVYDVKVRLANPALTNCKLNVTFRNERIEDILEIIAETLGLNLSQEGGEYVLEGISCSD